MRAVSRPRREYWVGWPTVKAILGDKVVPGYVDRKLAAEGFQGQQADDPDRPDRPHNLWEPLPGDHGAHGRFDDRARSSSHQLWASVHRVGLALGGLGTAALTAALVAARRP